MFECLKRCIKCKIIKNIDEFHKHKLSKGGHRGECKKCIKENGKKYRNEHKLEIFEKRKRYYLLNKDKIKDWNEKYRKSNQDKVNKRARSWAKRNPDKKKKIVKRWERKNPLKAKKLHLDATKRWIKNNPGITSFYTNKRRTIKMNANGSYKLEEWDKLKEKYNNMCLCCYKKEPEIKLVPDHIIPLIEGGNNNIQNIQSLCSRCNNVKWKKIVSLMELRQLI